MPAVEHEPVHDAMGRQGLRRRGTPHQLLLRCPVSELRMQGDEAAARDFRVDAARTAVDTGRDALRGRWPKERGDGSIDGHANPLSAKQRGLDGSTGGAIEERTIKQINAGKIWRFRKL